MKRFAMILVALMVAVMFFPQPASAATKSMKVYNQTIKIKSYVYCTDEQNVYRVNIKSGQVKMLTANMTYNAERTIYAMKSKGKYIYFIDGSDYYTGATIMRVKKSATHSNKKLAHTDGLIAYAISKSKIYYYSDDGKRVMKLNGKSNKKTKVKAKMTQKNRNAKGYSVVTYNDGSTFESYLKTPKKTILLKTMSVSDE